MIVTVNASRARGGEKQDACQLLVAPQWPWDPSASLQQRSCTRVGSLRIKRRSVTPNRVNKWQMLWISLSSITTEGLKGPRDCFHMKVASRQNRMKPGSHSANWMKLGCLVSAHEKNTIRHTNAEFQWSICFPHGSTEPTLEIKMCLDATAAEHNSLLKLFTMLGQSCSKITWSCVINSFRIFGMLNINMAATAF